MSTATAWRTGVASDPGLQRHENEDRVFVDEEAGIFLVVDGVGGQAAGEKAAETAVAIIPRELAKQTGPPEERVRLAITAANNEIYQLSQSHDEWRGMACVLTLAYVQDEHVTVGHVGDSRLYLAWDGKLRKLTSDHSPVGEQEDRGELTEEEAMQHPRRNEVFRDVGSKPREAHDEDFVEIRSFPFHSEAALLLCSDGLSDVVPAAEISAIVESYDGDPEAVARHLVDAANHAGGKDNISIVFAAGSEFVGTGALYLHENRTRHGTTRMRKGRSGWATLAGRLLWLAAGFVTGIGVWALFFNVSPGRIAPASMSSHARTPAVASPSMILVNPSDPKGIQKALASARAGDSVQVPEGRYSGPVELKDGVSLLSEHPGTAVIRTEGAEPAAAITATSVRSGRLSGFRIEGDAAHPLSVGLSLINSNVEVDDLEIIGAQECGIRIQGQSNAVLRANYIHGNSGCGVLISDQSAPRLAGNRISENGTRRGALRRGIEIFPPATPLLDNNVITGNGIQGFGNLSPAYDSEIRRRNIVEARP